MQRQVILAVLASLLTICLGCSTLERVGNALRGVEVGGQGLDTTEELVADYAVKGVPFLPSPLKEIALGILGGLGAYALARRKGKED